jgi:UDP-GlcNAc:undecaprenyl-phosphate GlcNAc-1-phosphate transferase
MTTYVVLFILALALSSVLTPLVRYVAIRRGLLDRPDRPQKIHERPTPRLGGLAIFAAFTLALVAPFFVEDRVALHFQEQFSEVIRLLIPSALVLLLGLYDDLRGADARIKFSVQGAAALLAYALGIQITRIWNPFGGTVELGLLSLPLTLLWLVGITNAFNLIDGLDGLSAGAALFATLTLLVAALFYDQPMMVTLTVALAGAIVGFLRYNFAPATIFLGDSGSLFLGFLLGALAVEGSQKSATAVAIAIPLVSFGLPILDTLWTLVRRALGGRPLFQGDLEHMHHMLLRRGLTRRQVVLVLYAACAGCGLFSLLFVNPQGKPLGILLVSLGASVVLVIQSLGYPEFQELLYSLRRALRHHRVLTRNIQWRRAIADLRWAESPDQVCAALLRVREIGDFDRIALRWRGSSGRRWSFSMSRRRQPSAPIWSLRLPLTDARGEQRGELRLRGTWRADGSVADRHLLALLQRELARALERVSPESAPAARSFSPMGGRGAGVA